MDALSNRQGFSNDDPNKLGEVNGEDISTEEYRDYLDQMTRRQQQQGQPVNDYSRQQMGQNIWDHLVDLAIREKEYSALDITTTDDEIADIFYGGRYDLAPFAEKLKELGVKVESPDQIREAIANTSDRELKRDAAKAARDIRKQMNFIKYQNLVKAGFVTTTAEAKYNYELNTQNVDYQVGVLSYATVADSTVKVTDDQLKEMYEKKKNNFKRKEGRDIKFVKFDHAASAKDEAVLVEELNRVKAEFAVFKGKDNMYIKSESDENYTPAYLKKGEGLPAIMDSSFASLSEGQIFGPYPENMGKRVWKVSKVLKVKNLADSVKVKHILLSLKNLPEVEGSDKFTFTDKDKLFSVSDSLYKKLKKNPELFEAAEVKHNDDFKTKMKGGDLGWVNKNGEFAYMFDSCMLGNVDQVFKITNSDGIHLVKIVQQGVASRKVLAGHIVRELKISDETKKQLWSEANKASDLFKNSKEAFDTVARKNAYSAMAQPGLGKNDLYVGSLLDARKVVKWAYEANEGDVSGVLEINGTYVVAKVEKAYEEGFTPWDDERVKPQLENFVRNEIKAQSMTKRINDAIAKGANTPYALKAAIPELYIDNAAPAPLANGGNYAQEPDVIGYAAALPLNKISKAIEGRNAVYVVLVKGRNGLKQISDFTPEIIDNNGKNKTYVDTYLREALKANEDVEDYRFEKLD